METIFLTVQGKAKLKAFINKYHSFLVKHNLRTLLIRFCTKSGLILCFGAAIPPNRHRNHI